MIGRDEVLEVSWKDSSTWVNGITQTRREPLHHGRRETNTETRARLRTRDNQEDHLESFQSHLPFFIEAIMTINN